MSGGQAGHGPAPEGGVALALQVTADAVEQVRLPVADYMSRSGLDEMAINRIEVVLEELVSNVVRHAAATGLWVSAACRDGTMRIAIEDDGSAFDPLAQPAPAPYTTLEDAVPGGQGIPLIKRLSRSVTYSRENGRNRICVAIDAKRK